MATWSPSDYALLAGALGATYADTQSTKDAIARGADETNPVLGRKPSGQDLDHAAIAAGLLGTGTAAVLPDSWRKPFLGGWTGLEAGLALHNQKVKGGAPTTKKFADGDTMPIQYAALGAGLGALLNRYGLRADVTPATDGGKGAQITVTKNFAKGGLVNRLGFAPRARGRKW